MHIYKPRSDLVDKNPKTSDRNALARPGASQRGHLKKIERENLLLIMVLAVSVSNLLSAVQALLRDDSTALLIWLYYSSTVVLPWVLYAGQVESRGPLVFFLVVGGPLLTIGGTLRLMLVQGAMGMDIPFIGTLNLVAGIVLIRSKAVAVFNPLIPMRQFHWRTGDGGGKFPKLIFREQTNSFGTRARSRDI